MRDDGKSRSRLNSHAKNEMQRVARAKTRPHEVVNIFMKTRSTQGRHYVEINKISYFHMKQSERKIIVTDSA